MAYLFGSANTDVIDMGASTTGGATFSLFVRMKPTASNSNTRLLVRVGEGSNVAAQLYLGASNGVNANFSGGTGGAGWAAALSAGTIVSLVYVFEGAGANHRIYADTDATPKASSAEANGPPTPSHFYIGNAEPSNTFSADATIYEVGWWSGTVLTGAECAAIGAGAPPSTNPTYYWPLVSDAVALFGGHNGSVTGASVVAHSGTNLYGAAIGPSPLLTTLRSLQDSRAA